MESYSRLIADHPRFLIYGKILHRKLFGEMLGRIWALPVPGG